MRGLRLLTAAWLLLAAAVSADDRVAGHWEGEIQVPGQPLVIKVDLESSGGLWSGSIDIPAQGAAGLPLKAIEVSEDASEVSFSIGGVPGHPTFRGTLDGDVISGRFTQGAADLGFRLSRQAVPGPARPQEPRPPYPYETEEVSFRNGPVTLAGTLTVPPGEGPFPGVLLISGSGLQDRDQTVFGHRPFLVWADHLTRSGLAVLRVDDAGAGGSTAHPQPPTTADFAGDAAAAVDLLMPRRAHRPRRSDGTQRGRSDRRHRRLATGGHRLRRASGRARGAGRRAAAPAERASLRGRRPAGGPPPGVARPPGPALRSPHLGAG